MKRRKNRLAAAVFIAIGLLLLAAAFSLAGYNLWDDRRADQASQDVLRVLERQILADYTNGQTAGQQPLLQNGSADAPDAMPEEIQKEMNATEIDGYRYIGVLEIPTLDLSLPVMEECDTTRLKTAPCRFSGSYYSDDMVVAGHSYLNHFRPLRWIEPDSEVLFTNVDGEVFRYRVVSVETLAPTQVEDMTRSSDKWDLTLFTCTPGGGSRCTVRCVRDTQ